MIYKGKEAEVVGVIFLYQIFNEMAEIKSKIEKKAENIMANNGEFEPNKSIELTDMHELRQPLVK